VGKSPGARYAYSRAQHQTTSGDAVLTVYLPDHDAGASGSGGDGSGEGSDRGPHAGEVVTLKQA
jgi:hypothetical protein